MKAAIAHQFKEPLCIEDVAQPEIKPGTVLVKVAACGVCHTDLHACHGDWPVKPKMPLIPGHEGVGTVINKAEDVTHINIGDKVGIPWLHSACGHCEHCLQGNENLCPEQKNSGYSVDGSYAEYCLANADYTIKIPDNLDFVEAAPLFCAGVTTYKALKASNIKPGQWVSIVGVGGLGHLAIQYAKAMGLNVIAVDTGNNKLSLAKELGADLCIDYQHTDPAQQIQTQFGGVQAVICTAASKAAFDSAYQSVKRGGKCVLVGLPNDALPIPIFDTVLKGISVIGSIVGTRQDLIECLEFAASGKVRAIVQTQPLANINQVFEQMLNSDIQGRIVLTMN
ncbi:alcohol dehydrogenase AdhP [Pseudoalteromonas luteoviolacea]|uniref:alcohol dehydrogenase n=1 Tax=Pseudoalteromonas luteoviolacea S4054 TaxID=1129367 RepID=A0A0F6AFQ2_9GAMM|nr:alcohol dehydrogenase AdhP [Pseudoalteromonas luteoviolacea]AOT09294.1 zinc-dependent alcohol dehydrogenase [Pseudoalteromonas luteoviolacea]AOT14206.1 zinc-dependent alcohol dehydrogenase [Pseudoalteromonas luteoviolacea]AOT19122.1 zinc-dependent alcohol dehydrogenase [Pseudoalteromonas luteoviolacea]KKE84988.1 alcohol dehydrogenase [Pseudoalteromonas luteoviolacea S4054]KZN70106.1 alcohol dehydrogenase [Pseudoalteromonas luteoviolacea S4047-1]